MDYGLDIIELPSEPIMTMTAIWNTYYFFWIPNILNLWYGSPHFIFAAEQANSSKVSVIIIRNSLMEFIIYCLYYREEIAVWPEGWKIERVSVCLCHTVFPLILNNSWGRLAISSHQKGSIISNILVTGNCTQNICFIIPLLTTNASWPSKCLKQK